MTLIAMPKKMLALRPIPVRIAPRILMVAGTVIVPVVALQVLHQRDLFVLNRLA